MEIGSAAAEAARKHDFPAEKAADKKLAGLPADATSDGKPARKPPTLLKPGEKIQQ